MNCDLIHVNPLDLAKFNRPVPRYTSYPTAPQFVPLQIEEVKKRWTLFDDSEKPLSLYIHIPFCKTMCLFCGCSVVLNRSPDRQSLYVAHLLQEISLVAKQFSKKRRLIQLHFGGGTPTALTEKQFQAVMEALQNHFAFDANGEISIEVDPRTVFADQGAKLTVLRELGFNRVSFGVQDLDPKVQEAVRRRQSEEMTVKTYLKARELGFEGINIDLIYGLPFQTPESFRKTAEKLLTLKPDRIAFYSYAKIPWLKAHQKAIPEETLPSTEEKFQIYLETRASFMQGGYTAIGMDHFALSSDPLSKAYFEKKLTRNFQGYSLALAEDMIGLGITAVGFLENSYLQNVKSLEEYQSFVQRGELPIFRGFFLSKEDLRRRFAIQSLMCHFELDKEHFKRQFGVDFDSHFTLEGESLKELEEQGLIELLPERIEATPRGRLFIRLVAATFDAYLQKGRFSSAI